jgi:hypothetical protein
MFGRVLAFESIPNAGSYVLIARGVFKEDTITRPMTLSGGGKAGGGKRPPPSGAARRSRQERDPRRAEHLSEALFARLIMLQ